MKELIVGTLRAAWRLVILAIGSTVVLIGVALIFTPGPAFVVIPVGLAILATEFVWARRLLRRMKQQGNQWVRAALGTDPDDKPRPADSAEDRQGGPPPPH